MEGKAPNPKIQAPEKSQAPNPKFQTSPKPQIPGGKRRPSAARTKVHNRNAGQENVGAVHVTDRVVPSEDAPRVRKALSFASGECFSNSFGFPCARMVLVSASRK